MNEATRGHAGHRLWLAAALLVTVTALHRFAFYGFRADLALFLDAGAGGLALSRDAVAAIHGRYASLTVVLGLLGGGLGFLLRPRITLALGLAAMTASQFLLRGPVAGEGLEPLLALHAAGHGCTLVGLLAAAGALFPDRARRLGVFFAMYAAINLGALLGPTALGPLADASDHDGVLTGTGYLLGLATVLATALCFVRTPERDDAAGFFEGSYAAMLFGGALVWFWVLTAATSAWSHALWIRSTAAAERIAGEPFFTWGTIAACMALALIAPTGVLRKRPFSDNRLTAWGLALAALGLVALTQVMGSAPERAAWLLGTSRGLASLAETLVYAAVAVLASASGPRLSSLFVGVYLTALGLTTKAASSMIFGPGLAWSLVLITLLLAAVIGCWHWEEHALPD